MCLLWGPPGVGKTHTAFALANHLLDKGRNVIVATALDLMAELRGSVTHGCGQGARVAECDGLVVIDDLGAEKSTDFAIQELYRIISKREAWESLTLVTTNLSPDQIAERKGPRMVSRLASGLVRELTGPDRRLSRDVERAKGRDRWPSGTARTRRDGRAVSRMRHSSSAQTRRWCAP